MIVAVEVFDGAGTSVNADTVTATADTLTPGEARLFGKSLSPG